MRKFSTIGIDCIAMNVNDIICMAAEPVAAVDYIALKQPNARLVGELTKGLTRGAKEASISIVGGETAILPDIVQGAGKDAFDLAASCVGVAEKKKTILDRKIREGDVIIGLASSGIHSNGLTLARKVLQQRHTLREEVPDFKESLGETLLTPTKIYSKAVLAALANNTAITGLAHITGGAFSKLNRLNRGRDFGFNLDSLPAPPPIFDLIREEGGIRRAEMYRSFNMGIGFCVISRAAAASRIVDRLSQDGIATSRIGRIVPSRGVFLNGKRI
jgi:phosphoribosylformylglycinamidine cyclo-ligase